MKNVYRLCFTANAITIEGDSVIYAINFIQGIIWTYRSYDGEEGPPLVVFDDQPGRSGEHTRNFLGAWRGHLMVDDYAGYKQLFRDPGIQELGCWAHARRKFFDLLAAHQSPVAQEAMERIKVLYEIERRGRELGISQRAARRQAEARPHLHAFHPWLTTTRLQVAQGSGTAKAMDYIP